MNIKRTIKKHKWKIVILLLISSFLIPFRLVIITSIYHKKTIGVVQNVKYKTESDAGKSYRISYSFDIGNQNIKTSQIRGSNQYKKGDTIEVRFFPFYPQMNFFYGKSLSHDEIVKLKEHEKFR